MDDIFAYIEEHQDRFITELFRLCRQPSISAQGTGIAEAALLVQHMLEETGARAHLVQTAGHPIIFGEIPGSGPHTLSYYNHYDVQPVDPLNLWHSEPFEPVIRDGRIFARGVADDKGHLVARLSAIAAWRAVRGDLPFRATFIVEGEEEVGSPHLDAFVRDHPDLAAANANVWEGSGKDAAGRMEVYLGCKGLAYVELIARGASRDLHSRLAGVVPNPAWRLVHALATLKDHHGHIQIPHFYDAIHALDPREIELIEQVPIDEAGERALIGIDAYRDGLTGPALRRALYLDPTCNIAGIVSGYTGAGSKTVLPSTAMAKLDFRLVPDMDPDTVVEQLRTHLINEGFDEIEVRPQHGVRPARSSIDAPIVGAFLRAIERVGAQDPVLTPWMTATGPMYQLCQQQGIPTISGECLDNADSRPHAPNENVLVSDFMEAIRVNALLIEEYGRAG